ncbi:MAG: hypothetical protein ACRDY0_10880, partial [Acidimicrobiales bacterium]
IARAGGRFLTILPRSRKEDELGRAWIAAGQVPWAEIARRPGRRRSDPEEIYWAAEAPSPSAEGYRISWIRSSQKRDQDAAARANRIERARAGLAELAAKLASTRCQIRSKTAAEDAAVSVLAEAGATRWVRVEVGETIDVEHRQEHRGRPGKDTRYRRVERRRFSLTVTVDSDAVAADAPSDGCFPFVTNETLSPAELLRTVVTPRVFLTVLRHWPDGGRHTVPAESDTRDLRGTGPSLSSARLCAPSVWRHGALHGGRRA